LSPSRTILVVEDDPEVRAAVADILTAEGFRVVEAIHGLEALRLLRAGLRPSVILLDLAMPVMDGFAFLKERGRDPQLAALPVVVTSAASSRRDLRGHDFIPKPAPLETFLAVIARNCCRT
jgi:CheY-like chemotaxis protein